MLNLSAEEKELLARLNISLDGIKPVAPKAPKSRVADLKIASISETRATKISNLDFTSGKVVRYCDCCGLISTTFVDHVKRGDDSGYATCTVETPSYEIKRTYRYNVLQCANCTDDKLKVKSNYDLMVMIKKLRSKILSNEKGASTTNA